LNLSDQGGKTFIPRCDLIQTVYAHIEKDPYQHSLTIYLTWEEKQSSYNKIGQVNGYRLRHGPQSNVEAPIAEKDAISEEYGPVPGSIVISFPLTTEFYGFQVCAEIGTLHYEEPIDWQNAAWLGSIDLRNYMPSVGLISININKQDDHHSDPEETTESSPEMSQDNENMSHPAKIVIIKPILVNSDWGFNLQLILTFISIASMIIACIWMMLLKNRSNATKKASISENEISTKKCFASMP